MQAPNATAWGATATASLVVTAPPVMPILVGQHWIGHRLPAGAMKG